MDAKYILLIQRQFDQPLSERETYELQGFLAGNESAAKLCENFRRLLEESENVDIPEKFKPVDAENLLTEILSAITQTKSRSWFSFVKQFVQGNKTKPQITSAHQDELAVLRKHRATAEGTSKAMDALRAKVVSEVAPVTSEDAVSLAEAIKRRMLSMPVEIDSPAQNPAAIVKTENEPLAKTQPPFQSPTPPVVPLQFNNAPPPSISESMDQLFSSSNWPVITPETVHDEQQKRQQEEQETKQQEPKQPEPKQPEPEQTSDEFEFKPGPGPAPFASVLKIRFQQQQQQVQPTATQQHAEHREQSAPGLNATNQVANNTPEPWPTASQDEWTLIEPEQFEPIWQLELEAREPESTWPTPDPTWAPATAAPHTDPTSAPPPAAPHTDPTSAPPPAAPQLDPKWAPPPAVNQSAPVWPAIEPPQEPVRLRPASLIPVDDIIAHVSHMFSEHIDDAPISAATAAPPAAVPIVEDPLGISSGQYPQIREMDLRRANAARLGGTSYTNESNGQIKALGNFLLDKHSAATIGNLSNVKPNLANARILSDEEALALQDCLSPIERLQGVAGCIILGYDGMIIMSSLPEHADKDALSAWALLTYMNTHDLVRVIGHNRLRQFVSRTLSGYLLLADFGQGLLLAVSDNASSEAILPLMKSVRRVTAA